MSFIYGCRLHAQYNGVSKEICVVVYKEWLPECLLSLSFQQTKKKRLAMFIQYQMQFTGIVLPKISAKIFVRKRKLFNDVIKISLLET